MPWTEDIPLVFIRVEIPLLDVIGVISVSVMDRERVSIGVVFVPDLVLDICIDLAGDVIVVKMAIFDELIVEVEVNFVVVDIGVDIGEEMDVDGGGDVDVDVDVVIVGIDVGGGGDEKVTLVVSTMLGRNCISMLV